MEYGRIVRESFELAWRHKLLWVFGLFASGSAGNLNFNTGSSDIDFTQADSFPEVLAAMFGVPLTMVVTLIVALAVFLLVAIVMGIISTGGLIDAINRIKRGSGRWSFGTSFSVGLDNFLKILGTGLLFFLIWGTATLITILIGILCFAIHTVVGVLYILAAIPVGLAAIWVTATVMLLAERAIVVRSAGILDSINEAWILFRKNLGPCALMFLISVGINIAVAMATMFVFLIVGGPTIAAALLGGVDLTLSFVLSALVFWPVGLVLGGFTGTATFNLYTLFYFELVEPTPSVTPSIPVPPTV